METGRTETTTEPTTATFTLHVGDTINADHDGNDEQGRIVAFCQFGPLLEFEGGVQAVVLWDRIDLTGVARVALDGSPVNAMTNAAFIHERIRERAEASPADRLAVAQEVMADLYAAVGRARALLDSPACDRAGRVTPGAIDFDNIETGLLDVISEALAAFHFGDPDGGVEVQADAA